MTSLTSALRRDATLLRPNRAMSSHYLSTTELPEVEQFGMYEAQRVKTKLLEQASGFAYHVNKVMFSTSFDNFLCAIIILNFVVIILETDIQTDDDAESPIWMQVNGWLTISLFTTELIARMYGERWSFWKDSWNIFDTIVISIDMLFSILEIWLGTLINVSALRVMRLFRLVRLFRMFPELHLMVAGLIGSFHAVFWGSALLLVVILTASILAVQIIHPLNKDLPLQGYYDGCNRCPKAFESVFQSALTFTQQIVAGDSWGTVTVPVIVAYPWTAIFFVGVYLVVGLALMNLITGVVVTVADQSREKLREQLEEEMMKNRMDARTELLVFCEDLDNNEDGKLSKDEFLDGYANNPNLKGILESMSVKESDLQVLWTILDENKSGKIPMNDFVNQVFKMKCSETHFMLTYIKYYITVIKDRLGEDVMNEIAKVLEKFDFDMGRVEREMSIVDSDLKAGVAAIDSDLNAIGQDVVAGIAELETHVDSIAADLKGERVESVVLDLNGRAQDQLVFQSDAKIDQCSFKNGRGLEQFDDLIDGARQVRLELLASFQQIDERLGLCLARTSSYLRQSVSEAAAIELDLDALSIPVSINPGDPGDEAWFRRRSLRSRALLARSKAKLQPMLKSKSKGEQTLRLIQL